MSNNWLDSRQSGALLHVSSLPSRFGIGNMGASARSYIDFLASAGFSYWQVCPVGPTGYGDSPYQSFSSFAGNPYFIDLEELIKAGLLTEEETIPLQNLPIDQIDYGALYTCFWPIMENAFNRFEASAAHSLDYQTFVTENYEWLDNYSTFMALKQRFDNVAWIHWPQEFRKASLFSEGSLTDSDRKEKRKHLFFQYLFYSQWSSLKEYSASKHIKLIGDVPIYVSIDSAECWKHPELFSIDNDGQPTSVAGVPPDYFSETGQRWGNPLYNWEQMKKDQYKWWIDRLSASFELYDIIRLDHFRGFDTYWKIPANAPDATQGEWIQGPGIDFFKELFQQLKDSKFIAEDLGYITEGVYKLRQETELPGMKIIQFGYDHDDNNVNLPHFFEANSVVYTGTHDNDTLNGWFDGLDEATRNKVTTYFQAHDKNPTEAFILSAFASVAKLCIVQIQDILDLPSSARMNRPGTETGNWRWRLHPTQLESLHTIYSNEYKILNQRYDRISDNRQRNYSAPPNQHINQSEEMHPTFSS